MHTAMPYNKPMLIGFDPAKDATNREKHGVSLAFGEGVLNDPERLEVRDVRFDYGEQRYVAYGMVAGRVWVCAYAAWSNQARIISVRKANDREQRRYHDIPR